MNISSFDRHPSPKLTLRCTSCGAKYRDNEPVWACIADVNGGKCGGLLAVDYNWRSLEIVDPRSNRPHSPTGLGIWRFADFLPLRVDSQRVTLGEGNTPIIPLPRWGERYGLGQVYAKLEYVSPTGSFKDRGAAVVVAKAVEWGIRRIVEDSSGNAGAAIAAYSARAGIPCDVFVPAAAPATKVRSIGRTGANVRAIQGTREAVTEAAIACIDNESTYYAAHNVNPYFVEGMKTAAYELLEALDFQPPDHLILPVGGGSLFVGLWRGCQDWKSRGWVPFCPRIHLAQSTGCAPLVRAYHQGDEDVDCIETEPTVAGGIEVKAPPRGRDILRILRKSAGTATAVSDDAIVEHRQLLAELEGIDIEPTAAVPLAALAVLSKERIIGSDEKVVVFFTGSGLKDPAPN